jgi:hypothetical protein
LPVGYRFALETYPPAEGILSERAAAGRETAELTPYVKVLAVGHVLLTPSMTAIPVAGLCEIRDSLKPFRNDIVAALDLFLGI